jgi:hypothetical protein
MAAIACIVFHNTHADGHEESLVEDDDRDDDKVVRPHAKRQWLAGQDYFLRGPPPSAGYGRIRLSVFVNQQLRVFGRTSQSSWSATAGADWGEAMDCGTNNGASSTQLEGRPEGRSKRGRTSKATVVDLQHAPRPMITLYAMMNQLLSAELNECLLL